MTDMFDEEQAQAYDQRFAKLAPLRDAYHLVAQLALSELPDDARVLVVGAGTGAELLYLADAFPRWRFTAVDPSAPMLARCRVRCRDAGVAARCEFHEGYVDSLPATDFDGATALLVSHFLVDPTQRRDFFREIAGRLRPHAPLVSFDLVMPTAYSEPLQQLWRRAWCFAGHTAEAVDQMLQTFGERVAVVAPSELAQLIAEAGFERPVLCYQALLMHGFVTRALDPSASV